MKCKNLFTGKNKKNIINLSAAVLAQRVVKVKTLRGIANSVDPDQTATSGSTLFANVIL